MHTSPEQISIGDRLLQEEIEDAFNTRFGYQISGINPRRDDADNRTSCCSLTKMARMTTP
jgi:putative restriction endonuclease